MDWQLIKKEKTTKMPCQIVLFSRDGKNWLFGLKKTMFNFRRGDERSF